MTPTAIIAIDPGPKESACVIFDGKTISYHAKLSNDTVAKNLSDGQRGYGWAYPCIIEWIEGYGKTVGNEIFHTCRWVGRFEQAAGGATLITRKQIKQHLCDSLQAKDTHIRAALIDRFGEPGTRKKPGPTYGIVGDEWSALAVAVVFWDTHDPPRA